MGEICQMNISKERELRIELRSAILLHSGGLDLAILRSTQFAEPGCSDTYTERRHTVTKTTTRTCEIP